MKITIDRIEESWVVCETQEQDMITLSISLFPEDIKEGDILNYENDIITPNPELTKIKKAEVENRFWKLVNPEK